MDDLHDEYSQRSGVELEACGLALRPPDVAVGVEDAVPEEIMECGEIVRSFRIILEASFEHVFNVGGVGGDDSADAAGAADLDGVRRRGG